ncbi:MAG: alternative ribosome rescue aminoacyl-tRNA hydrolase ArfB [Hyphomicrobiales bacterium]|nr:alternative ribosome rescue aminoacyl-tRNA hydrolase ArfB [Hyphomicrobiales bacterium]
MTLVSRPYRVDSGEIRFAFVRASGPGGQNVNKVSSAVQLRFDVRASASLRPAVKTRLQRLAGARLTKDGVIVIQADRYRTQERNRQDALDRLAALIGQAQVEPKKRRPTKPSRAEKLRRLTAKKQRGAKKALRGRPPETD